MPPRERRVGERGREAQDVGDLLARRARAPSPPRARRDRRRRARAARGRASRACARRGRAAAWPLDGLVGQAEDALQVVAVAALLPGRQPRVRQRAHRPAARPPARARAAAAPAAARSEAARRPARATRRAARGRRWPGLLTAQRTRAPSHAISRSGSSGVGSARRSPPSSAGPSQASGGAFGPSCGQLASCTPPLMISRSWARVAATYMTRRSSRRGALAGAIAQALVGERLLAGAVEPDEPQADLAAGDEQVLVAVGGPLATEVGDADDRELEALRGVDRHQPHGLDVAQLDRRVGLARLGLELGGREIGEPADVAPAVALEGGGEPQQLVDVRQPARAAGERQHVQVVGRRVDDAAQELVEREPRRERALGGEARREGVEPLAVVGGQPLAQLAVAGDRAPGVAAAGARDVHQRVGRQARRAARRAPRRAPSRRAGWRARRARRRGRARPGGPSSRDRRPTSSAAPAPRARARRPAGRRARAAARRCPRAGATRRRRARRRAAPAGAPRPGARPSCPGAPRRGRRPPSPPGR